jgi:excisionase family DNA binding protein
VTPKARETLPVFYSVERAAQQLDVSPKSIRRWIASGDLPVHRFGRSIRIAEADLVAFVKTRRGS